MTIENGLELPGSGIAAELVARLELSLGKATKRLARIEDAMRRPPSQPRMDRLMASGVATTGNVLWLTPDNNGPEQGKFWYVRSIAVGGVSPTTTAAGRADFYAMPTLPAAGGTLAQAGLQAWRDQATALPALAFYSRGAFPVRSPENLVIAVSNGTNNQMYVAAFLIEEFEESAASEVWGM